MKIFLRTITTCCLLFLTTACGPPPQKAQIGQPAPDFSLTDTKGKTWNLADLKGKVVFINFWASWCKPCVEEMPSMQKVNTFMASDQFVMLTILNNDQPSMADSMLARIGATFPVLVDSRHQVSRAYGLTGVPETYIIDKQGVLREKFIGGVQWDSPQSIQMLGKYVAQYPNIESSKQE